ncbi:MAG: DUF2393 domain-containing protein [Epsilonproteobacteria bacterium]|nr:DUF2393 domain-containing protein [Campylobacterota bacterium]
MAELKFSTLEYIHNFALYDYLAFAWFFLTFLILIILSIVIMRRAVKTSMFLLLFSFLFLLVAPFFLRYYLNTTLRTVSVDNIKFQKLNFSNTLIVDYKINNLSKIDFKECEIHISVFKPSASKFKLFVNKLKPITQRTILLKKKISVNTSVEERSIFDNYTYSKDINISVATQCY